MQNDNAQIAALSLMTGLVMLWEKVSAINEHDIDMVMKYSIGLLTLSMYGLKIRNEIKSRRKKRNSNSNNDG